METPKMNNSVMMSNCYSGDTWTSDQTTTIGDSQKFWQDQVGGTSAFEVRAPDDRILFSVAKTRR